MIKFYENDKQVLDDLQEISGTFNDDVLVGVINGEPVMAKAIRHCLLEQKQLVDCYLDILLAIGNLSGVQKKPSNINEKDFAYWRNLLIQDGATKLKEVSKDYKKELDSIILHSKDKMIYLFKYLMLSKYEKVQEIFWFDNLEDISEQEAEQCVKNAINKMTKSDWAKDGWLIRLVSNMRIEYAEIKGIR